MVGKVRKGEEVNKRQIRDKPEGFDSYEELYFSWYLCELIDNGFIDCYRYQPKTYELSGNKSYKTIKPLKTKLKEEEHTILQPHSYTPDYAIYWRPEAIGVFCKGLSESVTYDQKDAFFWVNMRVSGNYSLIDVKPMFDMQNMTRQFIINQKWLYDKHNIYCQKVIPEHLFKKTFTPERFLKTNKSGKDRKLDFKPRSLREYLLTFKKGC